MAFLAEAASAASGITSLMSALQTERSPTIFYEMRFPAGMKMRLVEFKMCHNFVKTFDAQKYNDTKAHELGGTLLRVCGSGFVTFYCDEHNTGLILTFSNPDVGKNKIDGELVMGMPTVEQGWKVWGRMDNCYGGEKLVSTLGGAKLYVRNHSGDPARGYYRLTK